MQMIFFFKTKIYLMIIYIKSIDNILVELQFKNNYKLKEIK